jgi:glycosyltransferase involved in cell wall biosynthesis
LLVLRLIGYNEKKGKEVPEGVSVVIAVHNELLNLKSLLPALLSQRYARFEVIIVNDRSDDGTVEFLRENYGNRENVRIVHVEDPDPSYNTKKYALSVGIQLAENEIILLTDGDCIPRSQEWIKEFAESYRPETDVIIGYSPYFPKKGFLNKLIRFEAFFTAVQYLGLALAGLPYMGVGRNLSYRKRLFIEANGFKPYEFVTGGDDDLFIQKVIQRNNFTLLINEKTHTVSIPKGKLTDWWQQKKRHLHAGKYYKRRFRLILGLVSGSQLGFYLSFLILLVQQEYLIWAMLGFGIRTFIIITTFALVSIKLNEKFNIISLPLLDFIYSVNYLIIGILAIFSRKISWK